MSGEADGVFQTAGSVLCLSALRKLVLPAVAKQAKAYDAEE